MLMLMLTLCNDNHKIYELLNVYVNVNVNFIK